MDNIPKNKEEIKSYRVSIFNNLLRNGHYQKMGIALWTYLVLIDKTTREIDQETGKKIGLVFGGKEISVKYLAGILGVSWWTIKRHLEILEKAGYISLRRGYRGFRITIFGSRKWGDKVSKNAKLEKSSNLAEMLTQVSRSAKLEVSTNAKLENQKIVVTPGSEKTSEVFHKGDITINNTRHHHHNNKHDDDFLSGKEKELTDLTETYLKLWKKLNPTVKYSKAKLKELLRPLLEKLGYGQLLELIGFMFRDDFWRRRVHNPEYFVANWGRILQAKGGSRVIPESEL